MSKTKKIFTEEEKRKISQNISDRIRKKLYEKKNNRNRVDKYNSGIWTPSGDVPNP